MPDPQTPPKRFDPPSSAPDGAMSERTRLSNLDPARVYCLANPNDFETGVPEMERLGWVIETKRKDGPRVVGGATAADGSALTVGGQIVMSRTRAAQEEYERTKLGMASMRSRAIGQKGGIDAVRGDQGKFAQVRENETNEPDA